MYYSDHLAVAEKEISSSNFFALDLLADAAFMVYDEEHRQAKPKTHSKTLSGEEEEKDERVFLLFPRKPRSCLVRRWRNPQQQKTHHNLNASSTSSPSSVLDLNSISSTDEPFNPLPSILGDKKMKNPQNPQNPRNPQNPSSRSSSCTATKKKKSLKRRATQEIKPSGEAKKAKVAPLSWIGRETPERLVNLMESMEGEDLKLIFEKTLCGTDVNKTQSRLKMPCQALIRSDFLTPVELGIIEEDINRNDKTGVGAILVDQRSVKMGVMLKRWETQQSYNYALVCGWNDVVGANKLKDGDSISLWSFRCRGVLCFALVPPPLPEA